MAWNIADLLVTLNLETAGFSQKMKEVKDSSASTAKSLREGFAAETINSSLQKLSATLKTQSGAWQQVGASATGAVGAAMQGFMQGGPLGAAIAATTSAITALVEEYNAVEAAAKEAADAAAAGHRVMEAAIASEGNALRQARKEADAHARARKDHSTDAIAMMKIEREELARQRADARETLKVQEGAYKLADAEYRRQENRKFATPEEVDNARAARDASRGSLLTNKQSTAAIEARYLAAAQKLTTAQQIARESYTPPPRLSGYDFKVASQRNDMRGFAASNADEPMDALTKALAAVDREAKKAAVEEKRLSEQREFSARRALDLANTERELALLRADEDFRGQQARQTQKNDLSSLQARAYIADITGEGHYGVGASMVGDVVAGAAQQSRLGQFGTSVAQGAELGGPIGAAAAGLADLVIQTKQFAKIMEYGDAILGDLVDVVGMLIEPFVPLAQILGALVHSVTTALAPFTSLSLVTRVITETLRLLGFVVAGAMGVFEWMGDKLKWVMMRIVQGVYDFLNLFFDYQAEADAAAAAAAAAGNRTLAETINGQITAYSNATNAANAMGEAARTAAGALNAPAFYKVARAVFNADTGRNVSGESGTAQDTQAMTNAGGAPTRGSVHPGFSGIVPAGGESYVFNNCTFNITGDVADFLEWLRTQGMIARGGVH